MSRPRPRSRARRRSVLLVAATVSAVGVGALPLAAQADATSPDVAAMQQHMDALVTEHRFPGALAAVRGPTAAWPT